MLVSVVCGIPGALNSGGISYIKHLSLRSILWWLGMAPRNYAQFLRYTVERRFIQQVGGRYWFLHRLLQDHFAGMELNQD